MLISKDIDLNQELIDTGITLGFVIQNLSENYETFRLILERNFILEINSEYISENKGFASRIFRITLHFQNNFFSFIVKIPTIDFIKKLFDNVFDLTEFEYKSEKLQNDTSILHNTECKFYEYFSESNFPMPKIYYLQEANDKNRGMIYLEDFAQTSTMDIFTPLSYKQLNTIFDYIKKFHVYQFNHMSKPWKGIFKFKVISEEFELKLTPKLLREFKKFPQDNSSRRLVDKLVKLFEDLKFKKYSHANCCDDLGIPKVVCHGDLWISNILWSKDKSEAEVKTFIDFAGTFEGNPMFDFAMILTCTDTITRRKIEKEFIEKYFDYLKNNIRFDNFEQFNIEKLKKAYGLAMTYCASRMATAATFHKEPKESYGNEEHEKNLFEYLDRTKFAIEDAADFMEENFSTFFIKADCKPVYPTIRF